MELIVISQNKFKIILSKKDTTELNIPLTYRECDGLEREVILNQIMNIVKQKTGKEYPDKKTTITLFPSKDGSCELFVTLYPKAESRSFNKQAITSEPQKNQTTYSIICLEKNIENIILLCKALKSRNYCYSSDLYLAKQNFYLLFLYHTYNKPSPFLKKIFDSYLSLCSEYALSRTGTDIDISYIKEHEQPLHKGKTVELFSDIFC